jgi:hypothetical protein
MTLIDIHKKNKEIFLSKLYRDNKPHSRACNIYDTITQGEKNCEDCLGENLNSLIVTVVDDFFTNYTPAISTKTDFYFSTYNFWLYTFVERIDFIFKILNKDNQNKLFSDFHRNNFKTLADIRKWMNFIKHPKEFLFCHWPKYVFQKSDIPINEKVITIDLKFIRKHYSQTENRVDKLEKQDQVWVLVPNLVELTEKFCDELNTFFDFICNNKIVSDYLKEKTSIEYIYEEPKGIHESTV